MKDARELFPFERIEKSVFESFANEQRPVDVQIRQPAPAVGDLLRFVVEIAKDGQHLCALLKRQPDFFAQRCNPPRGAFEIFGRSVQLPHNVGAARFVGILRQEILDRIVDDLQCISLFSINVAQPWFGDAERFVDEWELASYEPGYAALALAEFEPLIRARFGDGVLVHGDTANDCIA